MRTIRLIDSKSILAEASGYIEAYDWTIMPFTGCHYGCTYCYVPTMFYFRKRAATWGQDLDVKRNAAELLRKEAEKGKVAGKRFFLSSSTDPYNPAEREHCITRKILEVFCEYPPGLVMIQTRGILVTRDLDLLSQLQKLGVIVVVGMSITTDDDEVRKLFEPSCPSIARRVTALAEIHEAGLLTQGSLSPLLPCDPIKLADLVDPHASWVTVQPFHARGCGARTWTPALEILDQHGWEGWLEGGGAVERAMEVLRGYFGPRFHLGQEGFSLGWLG